MKIVLGLILGILLGGALVHVDPLDIFPASSGTDEASLGDCVIIIQPQNGGPRFTLGYDVTGPNEVEEAVLNIEPQEDLQITNMDGGTPYELPADSKHEVMLSDYKDSTRHTDVQGRGKPSTVKPVSGSFKPIDTYGGYLGLGVQLVDDKEVRVFAEYEKQSQQLTIKRP